MTYKCTKCGKGKPIIELRYNRQTLCKSCFNELFERRVRRTIRKGRLLEPTDKVAVGLSGGKDSTVTLHMLKKLTSRMPKSSLAAIIVDEGIRGYRGAAIKAAKRVCEAEDVGYHIFSVKDEYGLTMDQIAKKDRNVPACSYCGVIRRRILNDKARALGCDRMATGHNLDDEIQTTLMNIIRGDIRRIARMGSSVGVIKNNKFVQRIKPLRETPEKESAVYALVNGLGAEFSECPYSYDAFRKTVRDALNNIEEKHPGSKFQLLRTTDELIGLTRMQYDFKVGPGLCEKCGEPAAEKVCKTCQMVERIKTMSSS
ncbi:MAG: TIGR00269 family protein [Candidatus Altiarchaeota archaeon]